MTCKYCIHYDACKDMYDGGKDDFDDDVSAEFCDYFKNKAAYEEVKHGKWLQDFDEDYYCSVCGSYPKKDVDNYCPNCGAKMDGGKEE